MKTLDFTGLPNQKTAYSNFLDQLAREPIQDYEIEPARVADQKILLTGAAGSIGSQLALQLCAAHPAELIIVDQSETALYELETILTAEFPEIRKTSCVADVTDEVRMESIFAKSNPNVIVHAAAYKHVVVMEKHPYEALKVNFFGTKILADLAIKYSASYFLLVSTDKAVRPASVMGTTKRLAEMYIQHICQVRGATTNFITTRFGNVLGSSGSFTNILQNQIENGGPVTITHPFATRYFMTAPEACQLVLHALSTGKNGDIIFFDMGDRIPILSIAEKMITAYGLVPGQDIEMVFTGLRPGEKLHEDLLNDNETVKPGNCPKTRVAICSPIPVAAFKEMIGLLEMMMCRCNDREIAVLLKHLLPYLSGQRTDWTSLQDRITPSR